MGQTSSPSVFQVKSPPSKNLNGPNCSSRTTLFLLSEPSVGLVFDSEQSGLGPAESAAGTKSCFAARQVSATLAGPSVCFSGSCPPGLPESIITVSPAGVTISVAPPPSESIQSISSAFSVGPDCAEARAQTVKAISSMHTKRFMIGDLAGREICLANAATAKLNSL